MVAMRHDGKSYLVAAQDSAPLRHSVGLITSSSFVVDVNATRRRSCLVSRSVVHERNLLRPNPRMPARRAGVWTLERGPHLSVIREPHCGRSAIDGRALTQGNSGTRASSYLCGLLVNHFIDYSRIPTIKFSRHSSFILTLMLSARRPCRLLCQSRPQPASVPAPPCPG
jgi:hypothetical protein